MCDCSFYYILRYVFIEEGEVWQFLSSDSAVSVCRVEDFRVFAHQVLCSQL